MNSKINASRRECHPSNVAVGDVTAVRAALARLGWPSLAAWARAHDYERVTVRATVKRWGLRTDRTPHGGIARTLMRDLRATIDQEQRP